MTETPLYAQVFTPSEVKVLLVDDTPNNIKMLGSALSREGYQVIPAMNGEQALAATESHDPDMILLDVMMPDMDGYAVMEELRRRAGTVDTPVIFVTARSDEVDEERGIRLGAVDYITKPIKVAVALERIRTHLSLRFAQRRLAQQNQALLEAAKMRDDVERMMRHDLKGPLTAIIGLPSLMLCDELPGSPRIELLQRIRDAGRRMLNMINVSLDLYKMEAGLYKFTPSPVDLAATVESIAEETRADRASKGVGIKTLIDGRRAGNSDRFIVQGEELLCYSMLANLIKNAVEASPREGTVTVFMHSGDPKKIRVHNVGEVPAEVREIFFDKYSTHGKKGGTGLGTYSARLIAETQWGSISLDATQPGNTTVVVEMP